jgi:hypothetical protein
MGVIVPPTAIQSNAFERGFRKFQPIIGIRTGEVSTGIITGGIVIAILEEVNVMAQAIKPHYVLQMMPGQPAQRATDDIAQDNDPQTISRSGGGAIVLFDLRRTVIHG